MLYEWDLDNDGEYDDATGVTTDVVFDDDGSFTVGLRVTDLYGESDTDTADVLVDNVAPTLSLSGDASVDEGSPYTLYLSAVTDPGDDVISACTVDWGDGNSESCLSAIGGSLTHTYADGPNSHTIAVDLTDEDGTYEDADSLSVTVDNVAPTVDAGADQICLRGYDRGPGSSNLRRSRHGRQPHGDHRLGRRFILEPGVVTESDGSGTVAGSHVYADNGTYTVQVCVTDDDLAETCDTLDITVDNVAPTVGAGADQTVDEGTTVTLDPATFDDPGTADTHTAAIEWGDGSPAEAGVVIESNGSGTVAGSHVYADNGTYAVEVCVTDDDLAETCDTLDVTVDNVAPTVTLTGPTSVNGG